jgi:hypothetical protein
MGKMVRKRTAKVIKPITEKKEELAPDATPINIPIPNPEMTKPLYSMVCWAGEYKSDTWIGLGWEIFKHRLWHLWNDGSFTD